MLFQIPPEIINGLQKLRSLDVSTNKITKIPDEIGVLVNLKIVNISHNRLSKLAIMINSAGCPKLLHFFS